MKYKIVYFYNRLAGYPFPRKCICSSSCHGTPTCDCGNIDHGIWPRPPMLSIYALKETTLQATGVDYLLKRTTLSFTFYAYILRPRCTTRRPRDRYPRGVCCERAFIRRDFLGYGVGFLRRITGCGVLIISFTWYPRSFIQPRSLANRRRARDQMQTAAIRCNRVIKFSRFRAHE